MKCIDRWARRRFLGQLGAAVSALAIAPSAALAYARRLVNPDFTFARLRYDSGDWDYNPKVCANVLDAVVQYTTIPVHQQEVVITADSAELLAFPFLFMTGHKLVRFSEKERAGLARFVENGGLLFSDDCNHDVNGLYAKSFRRRWRGSFRREVRFQRSRTHTRSIAPSSGSPMVRRRPAMS
jgi:hypothetical protein